MERPSVAPQILRCRCARLAVPGSAKRTRDESVFLGHVPGPVRRQVDEFTAGLREILADTLIGVYLHGSLAMGCFNPERSDIDALIVTEEPMPVDVKRRCAKLLLQVSRAPIPIEVSFLTQRGLHPWRYPPPFDLHYSEMWRQQYAEDLASGAWRRWNDRERTDVDLAAHITHLRDRGVPLYGSPIQDVFPAVPRDNYLASILSDYREARADILCNQVYGVLNMLRVYRYLAEGPLCSKDEAGVWGVTALPEVLQSVVQAALGQYRGHSTVSDISPGVLQDFVRMMDEHVSPLMPGGLEQK